MKLNHLWVSWTHFEQCMKAQNTSQAPEVLWVSLWCFSMCLSGLMAQKMEVLMIHWRIAGAETMNFEWVKSPKSGICTPSEFFCKTELTDANVVAFFIQILLLRAFATSSDVIFSAFGGQEVNLGTLRILFLELFGTYVSQTVKNFSIGLLSRALIRFFRIQRNVHPLKS